MANELNVYFNVDEDNKCSIVDLDTIVVDYEMLKTICIIIANLCNFDSILLNETNSYGDGSVSRIYVDRDEDLLSFTNS